ncbi:hypothetical protein Fmac_019512 [Flemingia macrophylla]|uniref:DYW domain-containing protein n=1 Tax=Flemingia macrophylla TaxID=520843 RepID=A0ABD1M801_9FABA
MVLSCGSAAGVVFARHIAEICSRRSMDYYLSVSVGANPTTLLSEKGTTLSQVRQIHAYIIKTNLVTHALSVAKLVNALSQSSNPYDAVSVFAHALSRFPHLRGIEFSVPSALKACAKSRAFEEGKQIMSFVLKTHLWRDPFVTNSLLRMCFQVGTLELARSVFDNMPTRDLLSWNSLLSAFVLNHQPRKGLCLFTEMLSLGVRPDAPAVVSVLSAIAELGFVEEGKWMHAYIYSNKIHRSFSFVGSALINMYAKCGQIENAYAVFRSICPRRNVGDWNSMISGLALHGLGREAIEIFRDMERTGLKPDDITFLGLLSACNHGGLMDEGQFYFETMQVKYKIVPKIQHYGCIVDLLGRAGLLEKALDVIRNMPFEPDALIWKAILSASMKHNNIEMGHTAALRAIELAPQDSSCYVLLSNLYAKAGRWDDVSKVRSMMRKRGVRKIPGCSSILVDGRVHEFLVGKAMNLGYNQSVLSKLEEVVSKLKLEGYEPDLNQVFLDIEEGEKENQLTLHSEKMALAFGLSSVPEEENSQENLGRNQEGVSPHQLFNPGKGGVRTSLWEWVCMSGRGVVPQPHRKSYFLNLDYCECSVDII